MKVYKYRALPIDDWEKFKWVEEILLHRIIWCSRPDALNDTEEFIWKCDYTPTINTRNLLVALSHKYEDGIFNVLLPQIPTKDAVKSLMEPFFTEMIRGQRAEFGVSCFGRSPDNPALWKEYARSGEGVCIELDIPEDLLGDRYCLVDYVDEKTVHVDEVASMFIKENDQGFYRLCVLLKSRKWAAEREVRYVANRQDCKMRMEEARVTALYVGNEVSGEFRDRLRSLVDELDHDLAWFDVDAF